MVLAAAALTTLVAAALATALTVFAGHACTKELDSGMSRRRSIVGDKATPVTVETSRNNVSSPGLGLA